MTARTLPISTAGGLSVVHQPTSRYTVANLAEQAPAAAFRRRLRAWRRQLLGPDLSWQQERQLRVADLQPDAYTIALRGAR